MADELEDDSCFQLLEAGLPIYSKLACENNKLIGNPRTLQIIRNDNGSLATTLGMYPRNDDESTLRAKDVINLSHVAAVFPSAEFQKPGGVVLLAAKQEPTDGKLSVICWRFCFRDEAIESYNGVIEFLGQVGDLHSCIVNRSVPHFLMDLGDVAYKFLNATLQIGQRAPLVAPICCLLHLCVTTQSVVRSNDSDLISILNTWGKLEGYVAADVGNYIYGLAELHFSKSKDLQVRDAQEIATAIQKLNQQIQSAVDVKLVYDMKDLSNYVKNELAQELQGLKRTLERHGSMLEEIVLSLNGDAITAPSEEARLASSIKACKTVLDFKNMVDAGGPVNACLLRLEGLSAKFPGSIDDFAQDWATRLSHGDDKDALEIQKYKNRSMSLLYTLCDRCIGVPYAKEEPVEETLSKQDLVSKSLKIRVVNRILTACLPLNRADALYRLKLPGKKEPGCHWYAQDHVDKDQVWRDIQNSYAGEPTINKRLVWLMEVEELQLNKVDEFVEWMKPTQAPKTK